MIVSIIYLKNRKLLFLIGKEKYFLHDEIKERHDDGSNQFGIEVVIGS